MGLEDTQSGIHSIEELIGSIEELPTLPDVVQKINAMTSNPQTNASDIGRVISNDPALSFKILRLVNSAYYGFPRKINSVTKAIVLLGFNKVKNMALSASVVEAFKNSAHIAGFDFIKFWEHSVATGIGAEVVARHCHPHLADDAFVSALFHDLGKVVAVNHMVEAVRAFEHAKSQQILFHEASQAVLGVDHAKIGSLLIEHWNFPEGLVRTIRFWPFPDRATQGRELIACVHVANAMASACGIASPGDFALPSIAQSAHDELKLDRNKLEVMCREMLQGYDNASAFLELAK